MSRRGGAWKRRATQGLLAAAWLAGTEGVAWAAKSAEPKTPSYTLAYALAFVMAAVMVAVACKRFRSDNE